MTQQATVTSETSGLTATTDPETRLLLEKYRGEVQTDHLVDQKVDLTNLEDAEHKATDCARVKEQFYPEITPTLGDKKTRSSVARDDERFGQRGDNTQKDPNNPSIIVSLQSGGIFPTAVDPEVIAAAKERQKKALGGVRLDDEPEKSAFVTGQDFVSIRAKEHFHDGMKEMEVEHYRKAIIKFNKAICLWPEVIDFYVQRGECYLLICDYQSAILNLKKACCLDPENTELYEHLAFVYFLQGQCMFDEKLYDEALAVFSKATEMCPDESGYKTRIISCLGALQRHGECLNLINQRLEVDRENADLYVMRARLHELFRNVNLCSHDIRDALTLDPNHPEALKLKRKQINKSLENRRVAMQLSVLGKAKEALQKISVSIEMDPEEAQYHVLRGALHRRLGDFNAAIDDYLLALDKTDHAESSPTYQDAQRQLLLTYNDFAVECFAKGFYEEAVILLNKAVKGEKQEKGLYINRGDCFFKQGELNFALADYEQAKEMSADDQSIKTRLSVVQHEFGVIDYQEKNYQEAESRFSTAIDLNRRVGRFYMSRSRTRYMLEDHDGARFDVLCALLLDPSNEELLAVTSRLFPGRSIRDVLTSRQAEQARSLLKPSAGRISRRKESTSAQSDLQTPEERKSVPESLGNISPLYGRESLNPDLKVCMEEWQFNLSIVHEKKLIDHSIKRVLKDRKSLKYAGGRLRTMPSALELEKQTKPLVKPVKF